MRSSARRIVVWMTAITPRALFRVDAVGATVSATALGVFAAWFWPVLGMPRGTLMVLAALPVVFIAYDLVCLAGPRADRPAALRPIAMMNLGYCAVSAAMLGIHAPVLTTLGWLYFGGELLIVTGLASVQWRRAARP